MLPILSRNANLASAVTVLVDADRAVFDPSRVTPVDGSASAAGCLATASVLGAVGLAGAGLENLGVCHGEESDQSGKSSGSDLHFEELRSLLREKVRK